MKSFRLSSEIDKLKIFAGWSMLGIAVGFVIVTVINFQILLSEQWQGKLPRDIRLLPSGLFDNSTIIVLNNISRLIPENETIVISNHGPVTEYFTKHNTQIPRGVYSEDSLFDLMKKNDYKYLLVYRGASDVADLVSLFSASGLKKLDKNFILISHYDTEVNSIYLYLLRS